MDVDGVHRSPSDHLWSLLRVTSQNLDPGKHWYVLTSSLCGGVKPSRFAKNEIFRRFPEEIRSVPPADLKPAKQGCLFNNQPSKLLVVSSFGLLAALVRQQDLADSFLRSPKFVPVLRAVNQLALDDFEQSCSLGGKSFTSVPGSREMKNLQLKIDELESKIEELENKEERLSSFVSFSSPLATSSPLHSSKYESSNSNSSNSSVIEETLRSPSIGPTLKKRKVAHECRKVVVELDDVLHKYHETLACVLGNSFIFGNDEEKGKVSETLSEIVNLVIDAKGSKNGLEELLLPETYQRLLESMRVPDWVLLYFKLQSRLPDVGWQTLLNLTQLGRSGRSSDIAVLLTKNEIRAVKKLVFKVVRRTMSIQKMNTEFHSCGVDLTSVLVWAIREQRLLSSEDKDTMEFNIKLDGRPLGGRNQVAVGLVPINFTNKSSESALSVYPVAIANCKEKREQLTQLITNLNEQKRKVKKNGIVVDGKRYSIKFTVTLDYKALLLLLQKNDDEDYVLGGKGYTTEFCAYCDAIRACTCHGVGPDETCLDCLRSKVNIGRSTGLRDDLTFLLEEDLSNVNLCSLHCEMRNCEQLLGSLGLFAYRVGSLDELNQALSDHGPESCKGIPRVTVKQRPGQQTAVERNNIKVASFSGSFEREVLKHFDDIVERSLPIEKVINHYKHCPGAGKQVILDYVTFFEERRMYVTKIQEYGELTRDYGVRQETVKIEKGSDFEKFLTSRRNEWEIKLKEAEAKFLELSDISDKLADGPSEPKRKRGKKKSSVTCKEDPFASYAAELQIMFFKKVCSDWRDIALTIRDSIFEDDEEQLIDVHDIKCKEWGFLLKKLFGVHLGTGDYGHLVIDHSAMLLRQFRSLHKYSGQGFEASHKLHRSLYSKATNHDASAPGQSLDQILTHWFATMLLSLRYSFREAKNSIMFGKKKFSFRGCGWKAIDTRMWTKEHRDWIISIDKLFNEIFGGDFLVYVYDKEKGTSVDEHIMSALLEYNHNLWEREYLKQQPEFSEKETASNNSKQKHVLKQLDFADTQPTSAPRHAKAICSDDALKSAAIKTGSSGSKPVVIQDEKDEAGQISSHRNNKARPHYTQLASALSTASTRAELTALDVLIPPVSLITNFLAPLHAQIAYNNPTFIDPLTLVQRPCEAVVLTAKKLLSEERAKGNYPSGVVIEGFGQFSEQGLRTLQRFCEIPETKCKVAAEARWLSGLNCTSEELTVLQEVLWNRPTTSTILRYDRKSIDVISFCDLAEERYIDSFVIDVCISKFIEESTIQGRKDTLYFPTEFFQWMQVNDKAFKLNQLKTRLSQLTLFNNLQQILVPVFMVNHWGLIYVNLAGEVLYFDDGLTSVVPSTALPCVKDALSLLLELCPHHPSLQAKFWHLTQSFRRFGMPSQAPIDKKMIGVGSCGIGVIMAARDFIRNGPATVGNIKWRYCNMDKHRKDLMLQILSTWALG